MRSEDIEIKQKNEDNFLYKYKNNSKYKAKVQLIGWGIFIGILVLWINISSVFSDDSYQYLNEVTNTIIEEKEESSLINKLKVNNYLYKIEIIKNKENIEDKIYYDGQVFNNVKKIIKTYNDVIEEYYIENNNYYLKDNNTYSLVTSNNYYSFISETFMDLNTIINYINIGEIDSTTNFNDGKVVKNYVIILKNIILNNSEEYITISVLEDNINNILEFDVDYTNLYNFYDINKLNSLKVKYSISNFNEVEKFNDIIIK